jgi:hypothetical protein
MSPSLEHFPNEVFEAAVCLLALSDICALRLCNRAIAAKSTQDHFQSYFRTKHVDVTRSSLRELVDATQPGRLGCLIEHLVLVGVVNNTQALEVLLAREKYRIDEHSLEGESESEGGGMFEKEAKAKRDLGILKQRQADFEDLHQSGTDVRLLAEAFGNMATNSKTGKLLALSLEVLVYRENAELRLPPPRGGSWRLIWKSAADTYQTAIRALAASKLPLARLGVFNDRQLQRCSLGCNELDSIDVEGLAISFANLKSLSVSLSDRIIFQSIEDAERSYDPVEKRKSALDHYRERDDIEAEAQDEGNFIGLAKLLQHCSQLDDLAIHYFRIYARLRGNPDLCRERVLQRVAEAETLPRLTRLELRGVYAPEQDLLVLIRRTSVRKLFMYGVIMCRGTFKSVFEYCTSDVAGMEELHFHSLLEGGRSVYFEGLGARSSDAPSVEANQYRRGDTLRRNGDEVKEQIIYGFARDNVHPVVTSHDMQRVRLGVREYGPLVY